MAKSSAHYQRQYRQRLREQGLVKKEVWILPEHARLLQLYEESLRSKTPMPLSSNSERRVSMSETQAQWTNQTLLEALRGSDMIKSGAASVELIDGVSPSMVITMSDYGDLPVFLTVSGEQIVAESLLWSVEEVASIEAFNDAVLRTHKYFPLSTICLDHLEDGDYYQMFGALSSTSLLDNIVLEVEVLASNVIQATQFYSEFLKVPLAVSE